MIETPFRAQLGYLAHRAVATCLVAAGPGGDPLQFRPAVVEDCLAAHPFRHDRRRGFLLLSGMVATYCMTYRRGPEWTLIGVEASTTSGGRVDLLFEEAVTGAVEADELKASPAREGWSVREWDQLTRYVSDLAADYGSRFAGIRVVRLGAPAGVRYVRNLRDLGPRPAEVDL